MNRGEVWWADLPVPSGSEPGDRRPVVVIQADEFNASTIQTVIVAAVTTNTRLTMAPGNVFVDQRTGGLRKDSVINVSQLITVNRSFLASKIGRLPATVLRELEDGLRLVLAL